MRNNTAVLEYSRTSTSALSGATAGILGLTSLYGFAFYFLTSLMMTVSLDRLFIPIIAKFLGCCLFLTCFCLGAAALEERSTVEEVLQVAVRSLQARSHGRSICILLQLSKYPPPHSRFYFVIEFEGMLYFIIISSLILRQTYVLFWTFLYGMVHVY